jgi:hypothetical protein
MSDKPEEEFHHNTPQATLEMMYIDEYLQSQGYESIHDLCHLPEETAKLLMIQACKYASLKLAEIESRAQFRDEIRT